MKRKNFSKRLKKKKGKLKSNLKSVAKTSCLLFHRWSKTSTTVTFQLRWISAIHKPCGNYLTATTPVNLAYSLTKSSIVTFPSKQYKAFKTWLNARIRFTAWPRKHKNPSLVKLLLSMQNLVTSTSAKKIKYFVLHISTKSLITN